MGRGTGPRVVAAPRRPVTLPGVPAMKRGPVGLSVVVPVLDEREALVDLQGEIEAACGCSGRTREGIFDDYGSTDGSGELLERLAREHAGVSVVRLRRNFGKSAALRVGFEWRYGVAVVTID